ncbi:uncharacterized protein LOC120840351 isoform X1 [Ixodes scapularis]|uniref:uncharacterized protein LOC120840351 isoform X1 n=1 Tax=Ixodes scapularis TaxID=6945 RepID=UPI001AD7253E|nr:uncharacterized protein LOC120840351 isoform X1 [Ixodes scapularis]
METQAKLIGHLAEHLRSENAPLVCPFPGCVSKLRTSQSLRNHVSRYHRANRVGLQFHRASAATAGHDNEEVSGRDFEELVEDMSHGSASAHSSELTDSELLKKNVALFMLKLETQFHIPAKTVLYIQKEIANLHSLSQERVLQELSKSLPEDTMKSVRAGFMNDELNSLTSGDMRSTHMRHKHFKTHFEYVKPAEISLGINRQNSCSVFHYVNIEGSLRQLMKGGTMHFRANATAGFFTDFTTCSAFQDTHRDTLQIILYQDAFELANPLGSAKGNFKLLGVYMTLGNLPQHYRGVVESMQLVLLCREKDLKEFGQKRVFQPLINDLSRLEGSGLEFEGKMYKVKLSFIAGDNLGSHAIGGFTENFSSSKYFCRFCEVSRAEFEKDAEVIAQKRTVDSYKACLAYLEQNPCERERHGVTCDSPFNILQDFHVCKSGLPPCVGHDILEGIVRYDLALYVRYFVKTKGWLTYEYLNNRIATFKYNANDLKNKPAKLNSKVGKITGHAVQNWTFLRLLPLFVSTKVLDAKDSVWQLTLELMELVDLVMAPKITEAQVCYLKVLTGSYLYHRQVKFPEVKLRPKHHYMMHYGDLIQEFGPLCHVWTLRFESKHRYFKDCIRSMSNFKNVTKSLSERHQLFQSYLSSRGLFKVDEHDYMKAHDEASQLLHFQAFVSQNPEMFENASLCLKVVIKGTTYALNDYVILSGTRFDVCFGLILAIVADNLGVVTFILRHVAATFLPHVSLYKLHKQAGEVVHLHPDQLLDPVPHRPYFFGSNSVIRLNFSFPAVL